MTDPWEGLHEAINIAVEIARLGSKNMYVTHSPTDPEYSSSYDVKAVKAKK